jgi:hypothetical protein
MTKTYYKVTNTDLMSAWINNPKIAITYKIGEFVSPKVEGTFLAVFETEQQARSFIRVNQKYIKHLFKLFKCEIKNRCKNPWIPSSYRWTNIDRLNMILKLKNQKRKFLHRVISGEDLPYGTITCKQIKLLEEIKL